MENTTNNAEYMLRARDIYKSFHDNAVLRGISLDICRGEVLSIIGPSGSGKSTLLRCLNRLETIDKGSIEVKGEFLVKNGDSGRAEYAPNEKARTLLASMGMVFQQFNLFPHMTVLENLMEAPMQVKKQTREEIRPVAEELLR
ncbi:MAG: amino acid ABC transporter ATP-binding protein, partial [Schwartzia sp.]|nr:amino acid ABC transporter ATP-binding protein [Schwartzia sp. (in: firmicutes)]